MPSVAVVMSAQASSVLGAADGVYGPIGSSLGLGERTLDHRQQPQVEPRVVAAAPIAHLLLGRTDVLDRRGQNRTFGISRVQCVVETLGQFLLRMLGRLQRRRRPLADNALIARADVVQVALLRKQIGFGQREAAVRGFAECTVSGRACTMKSSPETPSFAHSMSIGRGLPARAV